MFLIAAAFMIERKYFMAASSKTARGRCHDDTGISLSPLKNDFKCTQMISLIFRFESKYDFLAATLGSMTLPPHGPAIESRARSVVA